MQGSCKNQTKPTWTFFVNPQVSTVRTEWPWCSSWAGSRTQKSPHWDSCPRWRMEAQSTSLPLQNWSTGQPGSNPWWRNWSLPLSRECERACVTQARQLGQLLCWRNTAVKEALLGPAREQLPSSLLHLCSKCLWNIPADKQGWKALMINSGKERDPCPWSDLAAKGWGSRNGPWSLSLANCFFFSFSLAWVGDVVSAFYPPKVWDRMFSIPDFIPLFPDCLSLSGAWYIPWMHWMCQSEICTQLYLWSLSLLLHLSSEGIAVR